MTAVKNSVVPELYEHYRGGKYRVLFTAPWYGTREPLQPNAPISVYVQPRLGDVVVSDVTHGKDVFKALWSGNGAYRAENDEPIVIYVALYGEGRVSARTLWEFTQEVEGGKTRFTRIG